MSTADKNSKLIGSGKTKVTVANVALDPITPIPFQVGKGTFSYSGGTKYIPFIDNSDNLAMTFMEARTISTTQDSCIDSIAECAIGDGLQIADDKTNDALNAWFECVNNESETIDDILNGICDGIGENGNCFIEIVKGSFNGKKYIKVYLHPLVHARFGPEDTKTGRPDTVLVGEAFAKKGYMSNLSKDIDEIPLYNPNRIKKSDNWKKSENNEYRTMLHVRNKVSGINHYGFPASKASLRYQIMEGKAAQFNIDNFDNNMVLGGMLIFKNAMTQEEANRNAKNIINSYTGQGKTGRIAVVSSENGVDDVKFVEFNTQKEGSFLELDRRLEDKIISSHKWSKEFYSTDASTLGKGAGYLRSLWDIKEKMVLKPLRNKLLNQFIYPLMNIWSEHFNDNAKDLRFSFASVIPMSFLGDLDPNAFIKVKDARSMADLDEDEENGEMYLTEVGAKSKATQNKKEGEDVTA